MEDPGHEASGSSGFRMSAVSRQRVRRAAQVGWLILVLLILAGCREPYQLHGTVISLPFPAPDTTLEGISGPVSLRDFAGRYTFVYFGYTHCPDVCPSTMASLKRVRAELGEDGEAMQVVMVTVDPERDTPEALAEYLSHFDRSFIGLSGDKEAIDETGAPFGLYYSVHEGSEAGGHLIDHTAAIFLLDRQNEAIVVYPYDVPADTLVDDLKYLLRSEGRTDSSLDRSLAAV
jgi:protein SCO1/2